jgi:hypothetical protein
MLLVCAPLAEEIPVSIERYFDDFQSLTVGVGVIAAMSLILPETVLLGDEALDRLMNLLIVHNTPFVALRKDVLRNGERPLSSNSSRRADTPSCGRDEHAADPNLETLSWLSASAA